MFAVHFLPKHHHYLCAQVDQVLPFRHLCSILRLLFWRKHCKFSNTHSGWSIVGTLIQSCETSIGLKTTTQTHTQEVVNFGHCQNLCCRWPHACIDVSTTRARDVASCGRILGQRERTWRRFNILPLSTAFKWGSSPAGLPGAPGVSLIYKHIMEAERDRKQGQRSIHL